MQPKESTPQVAIVSSLSDRAHIEPLVRGLRNRGYEVWWDGDGLIAGEGWEESTWKMLQRAPISCVLLSQASLGSPNFRRAIDVVLIAKRHLVPIRIAEIDTSALPSEIRQREWINFVNPRELDAVLDALERTLHAVSPEEGYEPQANNPAQKRPAPSPPRPPSLTLLLGDATSPVSWTVATGLLEAVEGAASLPSREPKFSVSFLSLLGSLMWREGEWAWIHELAKESGFDVDKVPHGVKRSPPATRPLRATTSVANLLQSARKFAEHSQTLADVHHLIAALIYEPAGHEKELEGYGFNRVIWANALIAEVTRRSPADVELFTTLRNEAFPVSKAPPEPNASQEQAEATPDAWSNATDDLKEAYAWAATIGQPIDVRALFAGLIRSAGQDADFWTIVASVSPELIPEAGQQPWSRWYQNLGLSLTSTESPTALTGLPLRTPEVDAVLDRAIALERRANIPEFKLSVGAVLLALWQPRAAGEQAAIDTLVPHLGLDADAFLTAIGNAEQNDKEFKALIEEILVLRRPLRPWERPHVDNDRVDGPIPPDRDLLDASRPALRFAKLLAARDVHPPIALGLFGNWGSGKTFFMGLMRDRITSLANSGGDYVSRVVQIEFNAWHYHDTNLWASLAMRIFEGLALELAGNKESDVEAIRKALHQKLRSSETRRNEANDRRAQALTRRATVSKELEEQRAKRDELEKRSVRLRLRAAWDVLRKDPMFAEFTTAVNGLRDHFGITTAIQSAEDLQRLRKDIDETSGRALGLFSAIGQRFHGLGRIVQTTGLLLLAVIAALSLGHGFQKVADYLAIKLPDFSTTVVEVATLISAVAAWCGRRVKEIRGAIDHVANIEAKLAAAEKPPLTKELENLQTEIAALDKTIHQASEELTAAEREIADATAEIDRINRGGLVYDFLQERRSSATYAGQLGLISTIRQDLDRLGVLLEDFAKAGENPIGRIILYIDDLDRCHPDKVVEVLQAVHLLLAFDLFNVVVGVDARWLERSLRRQYVGRSAQTKSEDPFSPQDYLEKIFQIPYALSRIDETGFKRLVGGMIETRTEYSQKERDRSEKQKKEAEAEKERLAAISNKDSETDAKDVAAAGDTAATESDSEAKKDAADSTKKEAPVVTGSVAPALYFEDHEETFIQLLYAFIDRPRLAKRFINIYRLLRVRADDEGESARFAGSSSSMEYRAALILLAIYVGHPTVAAKVVRGLGLSGEDATWQDLLQDLAAGRFPGVATTHQERAEIATVVEKLTFIGSRVPVEIAAYRRWAPRVACYSFDWHRPESAQPGDVPAQTKRAKA